jgi:hypothetical protein
VDYFLAALHKPTNVRYIYVIQHYLMERITGRDVYIHDIEGRLLYIHETAERNNYILVN